MIGVFVLSVFVAFVSGRPSDNIVPQNVVTVPPNCPTGQEWINEECRDVWSYLDASISNVVSVPPNCPPGQEYVNGECREVWIKAQIKNMIKIFKSIEHQNTITVPANCKPGQEWINGACRDVWRINYSIPKNVITVPPNCPVGQEFINGACRDVWRRASSAASENTKELVQIDELSDDRNVISVPSQCPAGYKLDALGVCREIFQKKKSPTYVPIST